MVEYEWLALFSIAVVVRIKEKTTTLLCKYKDSRELQRKEQYIAYMFLAF